jgi:HAD superfamily hydrolase (TIGR01549 family)
VDSNDAHAHAWVKALAMSGIDVPYAKVRRLIGKGGDKLLPEVTGISAEAPEGKRISRLRKEIFQKEHLASLRPFAMVKEFLARMKADGLRLAIASSAEADELDSLLEICGAADFVEAQTSSDDAENSKPDPDIIEAALAKLGLPPAQVFLLGDTPYDVAAGAKASVGVVGLRCGGWQDEELAGAVKIYDDIEDLLTHYAGSPFSPAATS